MKFVQLEFRDSHSFYTSDPLFLQSVHFPFNFGVSDWDRFSFEPLAPYTAEDGYTPSRSSPLQPTTDFYSLLLSPQGISEPSSTPTLPSSSTPNSPLTRPSFVQPPAVTQPSLRPPTPPVQVQEPASNNVEKFDFCPWTKHGQVCGYISWTYSSNKQIKRHMKAVHFQDTSLGYECPNTDCTHENYRFLRKDACNRHRRGCDPVQAPGYVPLPNIVSGSDAEVDRWMKARKKQKMEIIKKLRNGTPWSEDLLQPVSI